MKKLFSSALCFFLALSFAFSVCTGAYAKEILPTDSSSPSSGCVFLGIEGKYIQQSEEALKRINEIRYEACKEGVINPSTGAKLKLSDYVPIKWSSDLEYVARLRAAEASITMDHKRTNSKNIFFLTGPNGVSSYGEVLAWNFSESMIYGIDQWYEEKADWVNKTPGAVTGHYTQMIDPYNRYVGLGTFCSESPYYYNTTAGEFSSITGNIDQTPAKGIDNCIQTLEVDKRMLTGKYSIQGKSSLKPNEKSSLSLVTSVECVDYWGQSNYTGGLSVLSEVSFTSSDPSVVSVTSDGVVNAVKCGSAVITASAQGLGSAKITVKVEHSFKTVLTKATAEKNGKKESVCEFCGEKGESITINKASNISLSKKSFAYNGKVQKPTVTVKDCNGKTISSKHYTVKYSSGCQEIGTYKVKITFKGNFSGSKSLTFKIVPCAPSSLKAGSVKKSSVKVSWGKVKGAASYTVYKTADGKTWEKVGSTTKTSLSVSKLKASTKYKFKVKAFDKTKKFESPYSKSLSVRTTK